MFDEAPNNTSNEVTKSTMPLQCHD